MYPSLAWLKRQEYKYTNVICIKAYRSPKHAQAFKIENIIHQLKILNSNTKSGKDKTKSKKKGEDYSESSSSSLMNNLDGR